MLKSSGAKPRGILKSSGKFSKAKARVIAASTVPFLKCGLETRSNRQPR